MMSRLMLIATLAAVPCAAVRADAQAVRIEHAWARATPPNAQTAAAYFEATSIADDRIVAAATPVAGMAELHQSVADAGVMRMRPVAGGLALAPGHAVTLAPGGYHVMLMDLHGPLKAGDSFPLTLSFAHAPPLTVSVTVQPIGAAGPAMAPMTHR